MEGVRILKSYHIRSTYPRREVLAALGSISKRHFSVEDILAYLKRKKSKVSRASAYRAVKLFSREGLLKKIDLGKDFQMFESALDSSHHDHLYCLRCGMIIEFKESTIEELQKKVCQKVGLYPLHHTLRIVGLCRSCQRLSKPR